MGYIAILFGGPESVIVEHDDPWHPVNVLLGYVWRAWRPRQHVDVVDFCEVLFDIGCTGHWCNARLSSLLTMTKSCSAPSSHFDIPSTKWHDLLGATSSSSFSSSAVNTLSSINCEQTVLASISEDYHLLTTWLLALNSQGTPQFEAMAMHFDVSRQTISALWVRYITTQSGQDQVVT